MNCYLKEVEVWLIFFHMWVNYMQLSMQKISWTCECLCYWIQSLRNIEPISYNATKNMQGTHSLMYTCKHTITYASLYIELYEDTNTSQESVPLYLFSCVIVDDTATCEISILKRPHNVQSLDTLHTTTNGIQALTFRYAVCQSYMCHPYIFIFGSDALR